MHLQPNPSKVLILTQDETLLIKVFQVSFVLAYLQEMADLVQPLSYATNDFNSSNPVVIVTPTLFNQIQKHLSNFDVIFLTYF